MPTINTTLFDVVGDLVVDLRVVEHCFRGDASDIEAGSTESSALFDAGSLVA